MSGEVRVVYRKYDGSLHWHMTMKWLGEDEHGVWTGAHAPNVWRKGNGPPVLAEHEQVVLFPRERWWTASFNADPARTEIYCDITTPVRWPRPDEVTMVDLDLDVCRRRDGQVVLLDEDEFAEHQVKYSYPADVVAESERAAAWLQGALGDGREPFVHVYRSYLALLAEDRPA
jgi:protein associated with RNAse G/E